MRKGIVVYSCFCHFLFFTTLPLPIIKCMLLVLVVVCHHKTSNHALPELSGINQQITVVAFKNGQTAPSSGRCSVFFFWPQSPYRKRNMSHPPSRHSEVSYLLSEYRAAFIFKLCFRFDGGCEVQRVFVRCDHQRRQCSNIHTDLLQRTE